MIINKIIILLFTLNLLAGCTAPTTGRTATENKDNRQKPNPKMVYLFFEVEKSEDGKDMVKLTNKKVLDGFFKNEDFGAAKDMTNSFYKIILFDAKDQIYKTSHIDNPLSPVFESYGENSMEKQIGKLTKGEFFYRYNDYGNISKLEIYKSENDKSTLLFTLKL